MKKDLDWIRHKNETFQTGDNMFTAEFNAGVQDALEYVQELINQLDKPEVLSCMEKRISKTGVRISSSP